MRLPALLIAGTACALLFFLYRNLPDVPVVATEPISADVQTEWPEPAAEADGSVFGGGISGEVKKGSDIADDFRFAGTFFVSTAGATEVRKAVIDILREDRQVIVAEGDAVGGGVAVKRIFSDRIVLRRGADEFVLRLAFSGGNTDQDSADAADNNVSARAATVPGCETRFGRLLKPNSWMLERGRLMEYYNELFEEPERMLAVFDSFEPLYVGNSKKIEGYRITVRGEDAFFKEIGLKEGDIIRKVNSLKMTNRRRAEFFIKQVDANKLSAVVIDLERDGKPERLVYQIR
jgi:hypothetical protein